MFEKNIMKKFKVFAVFVLLLLIIVMDDRVVIGDCIVPNIDDGVVMVGGETYSSGSNVTGNDEAEIFCRLGYVALGGSSKAVCLESGSWMHIEDPPTWPVCRKTNKVYDTCGGGIAPKIFGGQTAELGEYPWMAKLEVMRVGSASKGLCGGSLINREWVLTAAHCLMRGGRVTSIDVRLGRVDFAPYTTTWEQHRSSQYHVVHSNYNEGGLFNNDFALIKLNHPVHFNQYVRKICLPTRRMCRRRSTVRRQSQGTAKIDGCGQGIIAGWGMMNEDNVVHLSSNLQKLNISVLSNLNCINAGLATKLTNAQLCAGSPVDGQGSCQGDSGGPFMCRRNNRFYAVGMVSYGTLDCGIADEPTVYGRVCSALSWIRNVTSAPSPTTQRTTTTQHVTTSKRPRVCPPPKIRNGHFPGWNGARNVGKQITVECNPGFRLKRRNRRIRCRGNLRWTKVKCERDRASSLATTTIATTTRNKCPLPPTVVNGYSFPISGEGGPGSRRRIGCNRGYRSVSGKFMFCGIDLEWHGNWACESTAQSTSMPATTRTTTTAWRRTTTLDLRCGPPPEIKNGYSILVEGTGLVGSRRRITCTNGAVNSGSDYITCLPNGQWSGTPFCLAISPVSVTLPITTLNTYGPRDLVTSSPAILIRGTAKTLDYPEGNRMYEPKQHRCWTFRVNYKHAIKFTLLLIDMEIYDDLELYDGDDSFAPLIANLKNQQVGSTFHTTNNRAHLCFTSDGSIFGLGFQLRYQSIRRRISPIYANVVDCQSLKARRNSNDGVYTIYPNGRSNAGIEVYCDMSTFGGGWTVFQRRVDASQSFAKNWLAYKNGFGNLRQNFWLGNENLHTITKAPSNSRDAGYQLLIKMTSKANLTSAYVVYDRFFIGNESTNYQLNLMEESICDTTLASGVFSGMNQQAFSTYDRDNDEYDLSCSTKYGRGGWWFDSCIIGAYLNGIYGKRRSDGGISWAFLGGAGINVALSRTEMMIRRKPVNAERFCTIPQRTLDTNLYNAAVGNDTEEVERLISKKATNSHRSWTTGGTAVHVSATKNNVNITTAILDIPSTDIDDRANKLFTPLMVAAGNGALQTTRLLVERGADVNARDIMGRTALAFALLKPYFEIAAYLQQNGAQ